MMMSQRREEVGRWRLSQRCGRALSHGSRLGALAEHVQGCVCLGHVDRRLFLRVRVQTVEERLKGTAERAFTSCRFAQASRKPVLQQ